MDLQVLRNYIMIVQTGSITNAAKLLHVSQPALSRQLKDLEAELDTTLMIRNRKELKLTEKGEFLLARAQEMVAMEDKTRQALQTQAIIGGDLYIGAGETQAMELIATVARQLQVKYPHTRVHITSGNMDDLNRQMRNGILDFTLFLSPTISENYEFIQLPYQDVWGVIMRTDDTLARLQVIRPHDLNQRNLILSRQRHLKENLEDWYGSSIDSERIVGTYNLIFNAALLVQKQFGIAIGLDHLIESSAHNGLTFRPLEGYPPLSAKLAWQKGRDLSKIAQAFLDELKNEIQKNQSKDGD